MQRRSALLTPMPVIEHVHGDVMAEKDKYLTVMDVKSALLTIRINKDDLDKHAFLTPNGKYSRRIMPPYGIWFLQSSAHDANCYTTQL